MFAFNAWSPEGFRRALEHFERAIERDPAYAPAYAGLGDTIGSMSYYGRIAPQDGFPRAQAAAERATALDPDLADAYGTLALGALFHRRNWPEAEGHFRRSIALNSKLATVRAFFAIFLASACRSTARRSCRPCVPGARRRTGRSASPRSPTSSRAA